MILKTGIIGGGITGLTTALALQKIGLQAVVFEQAEKLNEIGAGIWLQPNAVKILDWLGLKEQFKQQGVELDKMEITNHRLQPFKQISQEVVKDEAGNQTIAIHRGRLQKALYDEVIKHTEVKLNHAYHHHSVGPDGVKIQFSDSENQVNIMLGADGIHSSIRQIMFPGSNLRNTGQVCWRGVAKLELPEEMQNIGRESWGNQIRFGFSRISKNEVYWFAVAKVEHLSRSNDKGTQQYLLETYQDFHPVVLDLITNTESSTIHQAILQDLNRLPYWYNERVCLLGDAAHATTPNMGQGACQGIEDAYYISHLLYKYKNSPVDAFTAFQNQRCKKVDYIVNNSWRFGQMAHSSFGRVIMKMMMKITPEKVLKTQMNKLYAIENL